LFTPQISTTARPSPNSLTALATPNRSASTQSSSAVDSPLTACLTKSSMPVLARGADDVQRHPTSIHRRELHEPLLPHRTTLPDGSQRAPPSSPLLPFWRDKAVPGHGFVAPKRSRFWLATPTIRRLDPKPESPGSRMPALPTDPVSASPYRRKSLPALFR
jgi:hypothetical protein